MKRLFSGIQPTGMLTIGNYIGAVRNWISMQRDYECVFSIVDMHAFTVRQNPAAYRERVLSFYAQHLALGIDPVKSVLFVQSHVPAHAELTWILNCFTYIGELSRMTQFKDKSEKHADNINMGLMDYPVLMAADILLYQTAMVPVGIDQKQHIELTRDIAQRFNNLYGDTFVIPEPFIPALGAKICDLQHPEEKMSKTNPDTSGVISLMDAPDLIIKKFKRAVTDSGSEITASPEKPGITNLLSIYSVFADTTVEEAQARFSGKGYGSFKVATAEAVIEKLKPVQAEYDRLLNDKAYLEERIKDGAQRAAALAAPTLADVKRKIGWIIE